MRGGHSWLEKTVYIGKGSKGTDAVVWPALEEWSLGSVSGLHSMPFGGQILLCRG